MVSILLKTGMGKLSAQRLLFFLDNLLRAVFQWWMKPETNVGGVMNVNIPFVQFLYTEPHTFTCAPSRQTRGIARPQRHIQTKENLLRCKARANEECGLQRIVVW